MIRNTISYLCLFLALFLCFHDLRSQTREGQRVLAGQVTDSHKEPLAGASVFVRGHIKDGTSTDVNGYFSLELPEGKKIIIEASFLGMKPYAVEYTGQKEIRIVMEDDANMMESAIVMGTRT